MSIYFSPLFRNIKPVHTCFTETQTETQREVVFATVDTTGWNLIFLQAYTLGRLRGTLHSGRVGRAPGTLVTLTFRETFLWLCTAPSWPVLL